LYLFVFGSYRYNGQQSWRVPRRPQLPDLFTIILSAGKIGSSLRWNAGA
jgi:hypothetical protein